MSFDILGRWVRGLLALAILVCGILLIRGWIRELPRTTRARDPRTGLESSQPVRGMDRLRVWHFGHDRATSLLIAGSALLLLAFGGRFVSPLLVKKPGASGRSPEGRPSSLEAHDGCRLHLEEHGKEHAQPLLLVHGLGSDRTQWREAVEDFSKDFRVVTVDLPGHGRSGREADEVTIVSLARDLGDVIARIGSEDLVLVGHSLGGMIAMEWAARNPARAAEMAGLVLVHTTPQNPFTSLAPPAWHRALQKPVHEPLLRLTRRVPALMSVLQRLEYWNGSCHWQTAMSAFGGDENREQLDRIARLQASMRPGATARMALASIRFEARERLTFFDVPSLVVVADRDPVTVPEAGRRIAARIPDAKLLTLTHTRHMGFIEKRDEFARAVRRFRKVAAGSPPAAAAGS